MKFGQLILNLGTLDLMLPMWNQNHLWNEFTPLLDSKSVMVLKSVC